MNKNLIYSAIVLDDESQNKLKLLLELLLPNKDGIVGELLSKWDSSKTNILCHHTTLAFKPTDDIYEMWVNEHNTAVIELHATEIGISDNAIAVKISSPTIYPCANSIRHITLATNVLTNGKPKDSNDIRVWMKCADIKLLGTPKNFYRS